MEDIYPNLITGNIVCPILLLPKKCTALETNCDITDTVFLNMKITSLDTENNELCIYTGLCNIKLVDIYKINVESVDSSESNVSIPNSFDDTQVYQADNQSQVWIDPIRSPHVYNQYDGENCQELYMLSQDNNTKHITVEQHNTYITQNIYNYNESTDTSSDFESRKSKRSDTFKNYSSDSNLYSNEFDCEAYQPQLAEEFVSERGEIRARDDRRQIGVQSENSALKQLMSTNIQSASKQRKTILFLGQDSQCGQTVQKISIDDPLLECVGNGVIDHEVIIDDTLNKSHKRYQCDKCKQIFEQISTFRQHMVSTHRHDTCNKILGDFEYLCRECGKHLKNQNKFEQHCMRHGDPDLECNKCHKVFASKFTLRAHRKIHNRKFPCKFCTKSYSNDEELKSHLVKAHCIFSCDICRYTTKTCTELDAHQIICKSPVSLEPNETDSVDDISSESITSTPSSVDRALMLEQAELAKIEQVKEADTVLAKVMSNKIFLLNASKAREDRRFKKICDVCYKNFDRIGDLKRHLIEHIIKSTFAKTPVTSDGTLSIVCGVCEAETFTKVDSYKAHLREHAKLTLYKCTFCNKCFSDSSNFSKHKKIHGNTYFQCDLCQRKFNSKKMIAQHLEYHNITSPVNCHYCGKMFYFTSMLNKHIKCTHTKNMYSRYRCRFCFNYFKTLKDKWDHEWSVHSVRKSIIDCPICASKFRKYSELKRHYYDNHRMAVLPNKKVFMNEARKY